MKICPVNREWIHTHLLEPYLQGSEMVNRAWKGVDFHSLSNIRLSFKERVISWLIGTSLLIPLLNAVIWIAWQTFGKPEKFFDPYSPEVGPMPPPPLQVIIHPQPLLQPVHGAAPPPAPAAPAAPGQGRPPEIFTFNQGGKNSMIRTNWKVEHHSNLIVAHQQCDEYSSTSIYKPEGTISEFHRHSKDGTFDIWLIDPKHLRARLVNTGVAPVDKTIELPESALWIQQSTLGFKNFVLSNEKELIFYGVLPEKLLKFNPFGENPPLLIKAIAKKVGEEEVLGHGKLLKIVVVSAWGWPYNLTKGELWFDPATGVLKKFSDSGLLANKSGELVPTHP